MQAVIKSGVKYFQYQRTAKEEAIVNFIKNHHLYENGFDAKKISTAIRNQIETRSPDELRRLQLHFTKDINPLLFQIYEIILSHPKGLTYQAIFTILKKLTDIITISHYCRKLNKTNFISARHDKEGTVVIAKIYSTEQSIQQSLEAEDTPIIDPKDSFLIREFSMPTNIMLNLQSAHAYFKDGFTKEQITSKLLKVSEKKTISRIVDNLDITKVGERKGKVYSFKYKAKFDAIETYLNALDRKRDQVSIVTLKPQIEAWIRYKFAQIPATKNVLLELVNNHIKEYISSIGKKQSKRQCTPLKLNRFIYILNHIDQGSQTEYNLRTLIIDKQKNLNTGTMHKRSLTGILTGLEQLSIIWIENDIIYPKWKSMARREEEPKQLRSKRPKAIINEEDKIKKRVKVENCRVVGQNKYQKQLCASLLTIHLDSAYLKSVRVGYHKIRKYKKEMVQPQNQVLQKQSIIHLLETSVELPWLSSTNNSFEQICQSLDTIIKPYLVPENILLDDDLKKYLRIHPTSKLKQLEKRFGRNVKTKCEPLLHKHWMTIQQVQGDELYSLALPAQIYLI